MGKTNTPGRWTPLTITPQRAGSRESNQPGNGVEFIEPYMPDTPKRPGSGIGGRHTEGRGVGSGFNDAWKGSEFSGPADEHADDNRADNRVWGDSEGTKQIDWSGREATEKPATGWKGGNASRWTSADVESLLDSEVRSASDDDE